MGFPGGASGKEPACRCRRPKRHRFKPWVGKIPWSGAWQPTAVFLPGGSQGLRGLADYSPVSKRVGQDWSNLAHTHIIGYSCFTVSLSAVQWNKSAVCVHISPPSWTVLPTHPHPTPLGHHGAPSWAPFMRQQLPTSPLSHTWCVFQSQPPSTSPTSSHNIHTFVLYPCPVNRFISSDNIKCLQENTGRTLFDINHSKIFFDPPSRVLKIKQKYGPN